MLDHVGDLLMARAERSDVREEQSVFLDAREMLSRERPTLMSEFERQLHEVVAKRMNGGVAKKPDFAKVDARKLALVDTSAMDESVLSGNLTRVVENLCFDELADFNRAVGYLMGRPDMETAANPLAPAAIIDAFTEALRKIKADQRIKFTILKELNQSSLGDINAIYADLNRHLQNLRVMPKVRANIVHRGGGADVRPADGKAAAGAAPSSGGSVDLMDLLQRLATARAGFGQSQRAPAAAMPAGLPSGGIAIPPAQGGYPASGGVSGAMAGDGSPPVPGSLASLPMIGPYGGPRILVTQELGDALTRLQQGETGFDVGGTPIHFTGVPQDMHNVLRDIQDSPLGGKANQLEAMTIELVAMLFDFIFETRDLPDSIKALIGRLQIPVLKAAMLDGAFFSKKTHPSRLLVNALAQAGVGWTPTMGHEDPLYKKVESIVHRILDDFSDDIGLFEEMRKELEAYLAEEEKSAEENIQSSAEEINKRDRQQIAEVMAKVEVDKRLEQSPTPQFLATFLRHNWMLGLAEIFQRDGEDSPPWNAALSALDDLIWSVQPKRTAEERKRLVALLPDLLRRLHSGVHNIPWKPGERERFMANLVEAHAASVKPSLAQVPLPTVAVAEAAAAAAEEARAQGNTEAAEKASALAEAMATARAPEPAEPAPEVVQDHYADLAASLDRGMWIEFEGDDGQLAFAKLAWVSPLRGTYLFTNRQGQKAVSLTADELAERFRNDRARLVEAEPLVDRAFSSMMASLEQKFGEVAV